MLQLLTMLVVLLVGVAAPGNDGMVPSAPKPSPAALPIDAVTTLRASAVNDSALVLTWTEVSTHGSGVARYVVRVGLAFDSLPFSWTAQVDVMTGGCGAPVYGSTATGGRMRSCVLSGLNPNLGYAVQLAAYTGTLNVNASFGPLSNVAIAKTMQRVGPMLVWRPTLNPTDSLSIFEASEPYDFGPRRYPVHGMFPPGDRVASFYDSTGTLTALAYCLMVRP